MMTQTWHVVRGIKLALLFLCITDTGMDAQTRIGTFDSRALALAHYRSPQYTAVAELMAEHRKAKDANDTTAMKRLERRGGMLQAMKHDQVFGTGSVRDMLEDIRDRIPEVVEKHRLTAVVSKWELAYSGPDVTIVDVTDDLLSFFNPDETIRKMVQELRRHEPVKGAFLHDD